MIREIIEKAAREKATLYCRTYLGGDHELEPLTAYFCSALIAILTDPAVGFKEALEWSAHPKSPCICGSCKDIRAGFEAKLKQLEEMSK